ncbi:pantoate--beta-alanine ligase [Rickettsiella massiliensis]|uniref:pantoate--beta-alanine ligase n=1 Tax=Rickettsiella massiliensis TaxID=676517 RepID=UPI00029AA4FD|nr:pantoate--beta-alanine ligase [Rickettsiella massiliensis]
MNIVTQVNQWQSLRKKLTLQRIGFVHTMGHLHAGHLSLCARSQAENDLTVVAIFVNPTQFNEAKDLLSYPRTLAADKALLTVQKVDYLLLFSEPAIYIDGYDIQVQDKSELSTCFEGAFRPGHFSGMLTVVLKYLNLVQPTRAYYGEKDYQQLMLIKKLAKALFLEVEIMGCPTVRAEDGLALSSRNSRLTPQQRQKAASFAQLLQKKQAIEKTVQSLIDFGFRIDYVADYQGRRLAAVWLDDVRLIDNQPI